MQQVAVQLRPTINIAIGPRPIALMVKRGKSAMTNTDILINRKPIVSNQTMALYPISQAVNPRRSYMLQVAIQMSQRNTLVQIILLTPGSVLGLAQKYKMKCPIQTNRKWLILRVPQPVSQNYLQSFG